MNWRRRATRAVMANRFLVTMWAVVLTGIMSALAAGADGTPALEQGTATATGDPATTVVARVNGMTIFQNEVDRRIEGVTHGQKIDPDKLPLLQAKVLQEIVDDKLLHNYLTEKNLMGTTREVDAALDRLRASLAQQKSNIDDFLVRTHQTETSLRAILAEQLGWQKFVAKNTTDEILQALFNRMHQQFDGTLRRVSHILFRPEGPADAAKTKSLVDQASKVREDINSGKITFEAAAEQYSTGPSRHHGGDLGFIPIKGVMADTFSQAAFNIKPGEISTPVMSPFGVHLIKVTEEKPGKKTWQEVREALQPALSEVMLKQLTKQLEEATTIEYTADFPHFKKGTTELETQ